LFVLGLCIGSFVNVIIYRWSKGLSIIKPLFSFCPNCKKTLKWYHNIPIISYVILRGRCAYCKAPISLRYPLVELTCGFIMLWCYFKIKPLFGWEGFFTITLFLLVLVPIAFIDLEKKEIPDELSYLLIFSGWLLSILGFNPIIGAETSIVSGFAGVGLLFLINDVYYIFSGKDGMGMGDFKLMGGIGAFLGYKSFYYIIVIASLTGILTYGALILWEWVKGKGFNFNMEAQIPFGPFLALASLFYLFIWV